MINIAFTYGYVQGSSPLAGAEQVLAWQLLDLVMEGKVGCLVSSLLMVTLVLIVLHWIVCRGFFIENIYDHSEKWINLGAQRNIGFQIVSTPPKGQLPSNLDRTSESFFHPLRPFLHHPWKFHILVNIFDQNWKCITHKAILRSCPSPSYAVSTTLWIPQVLNHLWKSWMIHLCTDAAILYVNHYQVRNANRGIWINTPGLYFRWWNFLGPVLCHLSIFLNILWGEFI